MTAGAFALVIFCHVPLYAVGDAQARPDEKLLAYATETFVPLLGRLFALREENTPFRVTLAVSPILANQLNTPSFAKRFTDYLEARADAATRDVLYYSGAPVNLHPHSTSYADDAPPLGHGLQREADDHLRYLAQWHLDQIHEVQRIFTEVCASDLIAALRDLQDSGSVELMTTAATHAYLPLLSTEAAIHAQIHAAMNMHERLFGRKPESFYLPALAYRPDVRRADGSIRASLASVLQAHGIKAFIAETHLVRGGTPGTESSGVLRGTQGDIAPLYTFPQAPAHPQRGFSTLRAYGVQDDHSTEPLNVAVITPEERTRLQIAGSLLGYPSDFDYLDSRFRAVSSGLRYWRVTIKSFDLAQKDFYHPDWAGYKVEQHSEHFAHLVGDILRENEEGTLITTVIDSALLGQTWYEGIAWLAQILRQLHYYPNLELTTPAAYISANPPQTSITLPEGTSGVGGTHAAWANAQTAWLWESLHAAEETMRQLAQDHLNDAGDDARYVLNQAARELMLAQSGDWPLMITAQKNADYAAQRVANHLSNFSRLARSVAAGQPDVQLAQSSFRYNNVLEDVEFTWFAR